MKQSSPAICTHLSCQGPQFDTSPLPPQDGWPDQTVAACCPLFLLLLLLLLRLILLLLHLGYPFVATWPFSQLSRITARSLLAISRLEGALLWKCAPDRSSGARSSCPRPTGPTCGQKEWGERRSQWGASSPFLSSSQTRHCPHPLSQNPLPSPNRATDIQRQQQREWEEIGAQIGQLGVISKFTWITCKNRLSLANTETPGNC